MNRIEINRAHYYQSSRLRAYCCGCIHSESNTILICFFWAVLSFYFAVSAFLQQSPFYSYIDTVSQVAFGAINLLFGLVTLTSMVIFIFRNHIRRVNAVTGIITMMESKRTVFAITTNALGVIIVTLVNFIMFIKGRGDFMNWCIGTSVDYVENQYSNVNNNTALPENTLNNATDIYNCERLYQDEVKWSLLCLIIMSVVYIHWILIVASKNTYGFYNTQRRDDQLNFVYANAAPSGKKSSKLNILKSVKPSRNLLRDLIVHKQYGQFISPEDIAYDEKVDFNKQPTIAKNNSNVIHFEDNIYASKEEIQPPSSTYQQHTSYSPTNASTIANTNNI